MSLRTPRRRFGWPPAQARWTRAHVIDLPFSVNQPAPSLDDIRLIVRNGAHVEIGGKLEPIGVIAGASEQLLSDALDRTVEEAAEAFGVAVESLTLAVSPIQFDSTGWWWRLVALTA